MERKYVLGERLAFKFSALIYPKKNTTQESWGKFWRLYLDFCEWKGSKKEGVRRDRRRKKQWECKWMQLSGTISHADRERLFLLSELCVAWTHSSIEIQYWSLPTQTMTALNRLAFTVVCFLHQGASITQLGRRRKKLSSLPLPGFKAPSDFTPWRSIRLPLISIPCTVCPHAL